MLQGRTQFSRRSADSSQDPINVRRQEASAHKSARQAEEEARHTEPKSRIERIPNPNEQGQEEGMDDDDSQPMEEDII